MEALLAIAAISAASGILIGIMGVGGVILVPLLTGALGLPLVDAVAAATFAFLCAGLVAVALRRRQVRPGSHLLLWTTASLGSLLGAAALVRSPPGLVAAFIALVAVIAGVSLLLGRTREDRPPPGSRAVALLGTVAGAGSSLSGTGGAVVLLPLLALSGSAIGPAIAYAQSVQVPIAGLATAYYLFAGVFDPALAAAAALGVVPGTAMGARIGARLPKEALRGVVAGILVAVGAWYSYTLL